MQRRGVTMIEVLAVIAVVAVLLALLMPSMAMSRAAAKRIECVNNLKGLSLGVMNYHVAHNALPPIGDAAGRDLGMKPRLLAYIERVDLHNALNWGQAHDADANFTVRTSRPAVLLCPAESNVPTGRATLGAASGQIGYTSYPNNIGTFLRNHGGRFDGPAYELNGGVNGVPVTLREITDGTSSTLIFAEWICGTNDPTSPSIHRASVPDTGPIDLFALFKSCDTAMTGASSSKGADWLDPACGKGGGYSHVMPLNGVSCVFSNADFNKYATLIGPGSRHAGGINVAFLDGSVRFLKTTIGQPIWWALGTRAGGEILGEDSY